MTSSKKFTDYSLKTTPVANDLLLIADSEDLDHLKTVEIGTIVGVSPTNVIYVDPNFSSDITGKQYQTYADAYSYASSQIPSATNTFEIHLPSGEFAEDITTSYHIYVVGHNTILTGTVISVMSSPPVDYDWSYIKSCTVTKIQSSTYPSILSYIFYECTVQISSGVGTGTVLFVKNCELSGSAAIGLAADYSDALTCVILYSVIISGSFGNGTSCFSSNILSVNASFNNSSFSGCFLVGTTNLSLVSCFGQTCSIEGTVTIDGGHFENSNLSGDDIELLETASENFYFECCEIKVKDITLATRLMEVKGGSFDGQTINLSGTAQLKTYGVGGDVTVSDPSKWTDYGGIFNNDGTTLASDYQNDAIREVAAALDTAKALIASQQTVLPIAWGKNGASDSPDASEDYLNTNGAETVRKFSGTAATNQYLIIPWPVPHNIKVSSGVTFQVKGILSEAVAPALNEILSFKLSGYSVGAADSTNGTYGTAVSSSFTFPGSGYTQNDIALTAVSSAVTITDLARNEKVYFKLERDTAVGGVDSYGQKFAVSELILYWTAE